MHVINVIIKVMEVMDIDGQRWSWKKWTLLWDRSCNACDRRDRHCHGRNGHCYRIKAVMHVIDMTAMVMEVMDIIIGLKL